MNLPEFIKKNKKLCCRYFVQKIHLNTVLKKVLKIDRTDSVSWRPVHIYGDLDDEGSCDEDDLHGKCEANERCESPEPEMASQTPSEVEAEREKKPKIFWSCRAVSSKKCSSSVALHLMVKNQFWWSVWSRKEEHNLENTQRIGLTLCLP